jgi:hypothetical protein
LLSLEAGAVTEGDVEEGGGGINGINEAAEALIGLVGSSFGQGEDEDGMKVDEEAGGPGEYMTMPGERMGPGKVVWAKVEGHDWWPARVVRRRAVPKEVGARCRRKEGNQLTFGASASVLCERKACFMIWLLDC